MGGQTGLTEETPQPVVYASAGGTPEEAPVEVATPAFTPEPTPEPTPVYPV